MISRRPHSPRRSARTTIDIYCLCELIELANTGPHLRWDGHTRLRRGRGKNRMHFPGNPEAIRTELREQSGLCQKPFLSSILTDELPHDREKQLDTELIARRVKI